MNIMSTSPNAESGSRAAVGGGAPVRLGSGPRPQFIALSELAHHRLTSRDMLPLLPAVLISFVFNFGFVVALILFNDSPTNAAGSKKVTIGQDEVTNVPKKDNEDEPIDLTADDRMRESDMNDAKMVIAGL